MGKSKYQALKKNVVDRSQQADAAENLFSFARIWHFIPTQTASPLSNSFLEHCNQASADSR